MDINRELAELLGLCWHEFAPKFPPHCLCGRINCMEENRTFTTPQDFMDCFEKLVALGKWDEFEDYAYLHYCEGETDDGIPNFNQWLLSRTESGHYRLCVLCAEWLKGGEG
jgi:hypothetical protein